MALLLTLSLAVGASKIAVTSKVSGKVEFTHVDVNQFNDLKAGTILEDGDQIRTGATGFAAIIFIDDKSILKIRSGSTIVINGDRGTSAISKKIDMEAGTIRAKITRQKEGEFVIQTPTSVASVKGTDFWMQSDPTIGDRLFGLDGIISLTNLLSGLTQDVTAGITGIAGLDGSLDLVQTNPANVPSDPEEGSSKAPSILKIEYEDENGNRKVLIIEYQ